MEFNLKEDVINYLDGPHFTNDENSLLRVERYIVDRINRDNTLLNYGLNNLKDYFENCVLEDENITDMYELTNELFEGAREDRTLTFSSLQAEMELIAIYSLNGLFETLEDIGYEPTKLTSEQMHLIVCEEEFNDYFSEKLEEVQNEYPKLDDRASLIKTCLEISKEHNLGLENINNKEINKLEKKKSFRIKDDAELER